MTKIVLCGANGKMGHTLAGCIAKREDCTVIAGIDSYTKQYDSFPIVETVQSLGFLFCCSVLAGLMGVIALWFGFRKKSVPVTIVASVVLATIVCQIISSALAFLPMMGAVLGVTGILATLAIKNLLRQVNNMEV